MSDKSSNIKKKNNKIASLFFVFIILGVFYFVYQAIQSDNPELKSIENRTSKIKQMVSEGVQDFQASTIHNSIFKLSQLNHKVIILNFWASWCGPCVEEFPSLLKMMEQTNGQVALVLISLDSDEEQMKEFLKNYNLTNPNIYLLKDPNYTLAENFGTFKLPESYILNSQKILIKKISGSVDWTEPNLLNLIHNQIQR